MRIGLITNRIKDKENMTEIMRQAFLSKDSTLEFVTCSTTDFQDNRDIEQCTCWIVFGGDGSILQVAKSSAKLRIPILGFNLGRLGFMTQAGPEDLDFVVDKVLQQDYSINERNMLSVSVIDDSGKPILDDVLGLNDVVLGTKMFSRVMRCTVTIRNQIVDDFWGDGIIVATPTGSTAYAISAGGPIVAPNAPCLLVVPVCAHALRTRPVVVRDDEEIHIQVSEKRSNICMAVDGRVIYDLSNGYQVNVKKAMLTVPFIHLGKQVFYEIVHEKLCSPVL